MTMASVTALKPILQYEIRIRSGVSNFGSGRRPKTENMAIRPELMLVSGGGDLELHIAEFGTR